MEIALIVIGVVIIGYLHTISTRQRSAESLPKRSMVVYTMLKYIVADGPEYGPFYCRKVIKLDYIPQLGMEINLDGVDMQVFFGENACLRALHINSEATVQPDVLVCTPRRIK